MLKKVNLILSIFFAILIYFNQEALAFHKKNVLPQGKQVDWNPEEETTRNARDRVKSEYCGYKAREESLIEEVEDPSQYGVVSGTILENGIIDIKEIVEKPKKPKSKNAIIAIYIFKPKIFKYLSLVKKQSSPQNQLSDAFEMALKKGDKMIGVVLKKNEKRVDIGTPETYSKVLVSLK